MLLFRRIWSLRSRARIDREIEEELNAHIQMRTADNVAAGMSDTEARRDALLRFGNPTAMKERVAGVDTALKLDNLWNDVRFAGRRLRKSPGFTITVVLTLALGIGATTAIFSVAYGVLLRSLPFRDAGRIVAISETLPQISGGAEVSFPDYEDWKKQQTSFEQIAAYSIVNPEMVSLTWDGHAEQVHRVLASSNLFSLMGVVPAIGRLFVENDDSPKANHVVVLSSEAWQRYFGGDPRVIGRTVDMNGASYTVIGVLPTGAAYPGVGEFWMPLSLIDQESRTSRVYHSVNVLGRLHLGVSLDQARADMRTIASRLAQVYPATNHNIGVLAVPLRDQLVGVLRPAILSLMGCVVLVLLIACTNVANLLMVRASANVREVAVKQALGASRMRLFTQSLAETLILCLLGGVVGTAFAMLTLPLLRVAFAHTDGVDLSLIELIRLDVPVLLVALGVCLFTAFIFGMVSLAKTPGSLTAALSSGDRGNTGRQGARRRGLVSTQIAIAIVVLFLGALLARSFQRLIQVDPGFRTDHLLSLEITLPEPRYTDLTDGTRHFYESLIEKVTQSPGVLSAGTTTALPLKSSRSLTRFLILGAPPDQSGAFPMAQRRYISTGFFRTMVLSLIAGRTFEQRDFETGQNLIVVNQAFVRQYLAGRDPLSSTVLLGVMSPNPDRYSVIGVVSNVHDLGIETDAEPEIYLPGFGTHAVVLVRTQVDPMSVLPEIRGAVKDLDPSQPIYHVATIGNVFSDSLVRQRMTALLLGIFGLVALTLAAVGIYGVVSYSVTQRTREIGLRMAVGATRGDILNLIMREAATFTTLGVVVGLVVALICAHFVSSLLFQTSSVDLVSVCVTVVSLLFIAAIAAILPASRAATINPTEALRSE
jgi:predicted permease